MAKLSAGILLFRRRPAGVEVMLVHPGGPFWARKDAGAWSIPKGLMNEGEDRLVTQQVVHHERVQPKPVGIAEGRCSAEAEPSQAPAPTVRR